MLKINGKNQQTGLLGGNGILPGEQVARFFADGEALYSDEGTREMNTLIVVKAMTDLVPLCNSSV